MAIVSWPHGIVHSNATTCAICQRNVPFTHASAGLCSAVGTQAFACDDHFKNSSELIVGWSTFTITEQVQSQSALHSLYCYGALQ